MTSSSDSGAPSTRGARKGMLRPILRAVPQPELPAGQMRPTLSRWIPAEEIEAVQAWRPSALGEPPAGASLIGKRPSLTIRAARDFALARHGNPPLEEPDTEPTEPPPPTPQEIEAMVAEGRKAGYQDGYRDGLAALENFKRSFAQQMTQQIGKLVQGFDAQHDVLEAQMAATLTRTALQLARQVVRSELSTQPELVEQVATDAVHAVLLSARQVQVLVNPNDLELVAQGAGEALAERGARLVAAPHIQRGGVVVESDVGVIDARIEARWARAVHALGGDEGGVNATPWTDTQLNTPALDLQDMAAEEPLTSSTDHSADTPSA